MELSESIIVSHPLNVVLTSLYDAVELESYAMRGLLNGSAFGYVNGEVKIRLEQIDEGCEPFNDTDIKMGGRIDE